MNYLERCNQFLELRARSACLENCPSCKNPWFPTFTRTVNGHFPALHAKKGEEKGTSSQNLKEVTKPRLKEKMQSLKKVNKPRLKEENKIFGVKKRKLKEEDNIVKAQLVKRMSTRSGRVLKTPKKFLSIGEEEENDVESKRDIRLEEVKVKDVRVQLVKLPTEVEVDPVAKLSRKEVEKFKKKEKGVKSAGANMLMRELVDSIEVFGVEDHVEMGDENLNDEAHLVKSSGVQKLLESWEDWESEAALGSVEGPWRAIGSERFVCEGFDFLKVDTMLVTSDGDQSGLVMGHDGDESECLTSELDPSSLLNCMDLTMFGGEGELKRGSSQRPVLRR